MDLRSCCQNKFSDIWESQNSTDTAKAMDIVIQELLQAYDLALEVKLKVR